MSIFNSELIKIIEDKDTLKSIATVSRDGIPHVVYKQSLHIEGDMVVFYDLIQSSQVNKNLVNSIWFNGEVAISILSKDKRNFLITGRPVKSVTAGKNFENIYSKLQDKKGKEVELSAIWYIEPITIREETYETRRKEEQEKYPYIRHLDLI